MKAFCCFEEAVVSSLHKEKAAGPKLTHTLVWISCLHGAASTCALAETPWEDNQPHTTRHCFQFTWIAAHHTSHQSTSKCMKGGNSGSAGAAFPSPTSQTWKSWSSDMQVNALHICLAMCPRPSSEVPFALVQEWGTLPGSFAKVCLVSVCVAAKYQNLGMKTACQGHLPVQMH